MRRLFLALLLVGCSSSKDEPGLPVDDGNPRMPNLDGSVMDARARRDATSWTPPDPLPAVQVTCNDDACRFIADRCNKDEDCCQPWNNPGSRVSCIAAPNGFCDVILILDTPLWNQALPVCLLDGGTPPIAEARSSLARCNAPDCTLEGEPCDKDLDCCQPVNQPSVRVTCSFEQRCRLAAWAEDRRWTPAPTCLADGGLGDAPDGSLSVCLPRGTAGCERDEDCCHPPGHDFAPPVCLGGYCDVTGP